MSDLDLEERAATRPGAARTLVRITAVLAAAVGATGLLVAVVVFGPFAGIRSIFVTHDPHWGTCSTFALSDPCHGVPLSTVETVTGLHMPAGSRVVDSTAGAVDFKGYQNLTALIAYPASGASPLTGPGVLGPTSISAKDRVYSTDTAKLADHGVRRFAAYTSTPKLTSWTCVTGSSGGLTYLSIAVYEIDVHSNPFDH